MDVKIKGKELIVKHILKRNETYKVSKSDKFQTISIFKKPQTVSGFSNVCEDGLGILVIDYDNVSLSIIFEDFQLIQKKYGLPQAYLFKTNQNNYHVICLKKFPQYKISEILKYTRCDDNYRSMPLRNPFRSYVLRLSSKLGSKKPKFLKLIGKTNNSSFEISSAHKRLLCRLYNLSHPLYKKTDKLTKLRLTMYET